MEPVSHNEYMMRYYRQVFAYRSMAFGQTHWSTLKVEQLARARAARIIAGSV